MKTISFYHRHEGITEELIAPYVNNLSNGFHHFSVKTNEIHTTSCIEVKDTTIVKWMYRGDREYPSPIAVNEIPQKTSTLSIICDIDDDEVFIITAYWGELAPEEPATTIGYRFNNSVKFWSTHALCFEEGEIYQLGEQPDWY
jgi:hypothetical protein